MCEPFVWNWMFVESNTTIKMKKGRREEDEEKKKREQVSGDLPLHHGEHGEILQKGVHRAQLQERVAQTAHPEIDPV